jgi:phage terminase large subunit-like protein
MAANRVGKTESAGGYELTCHLIGWYPDWWEGYRFDRPVNVWVAGQTNETVRDILQAKFLGPVAERGTGLIPGQNIRKMKAKSGIADSIDTVEVKHSSGRSSTIGFKSYDQGRKSFEGTSKDVILLDEEPPFSVYGECLIRTAATVPGQRGGMIMATFTPLLGLSETALYFLPGGVPLQA